MRLQLQFLRARRCAVDVGAGHCPHGRAGKSVRNLEGHIRKAAPFVEAAAVDRSHDDTSEGGASACVPWSPAPSWLEIGSDLGHPEIAPDSSSSDEDDALLGDSNGSVSVDDLIRELKQLRASGLEKQFNALYSSAKAITAAADSESADAVLFSTIIEMITCNELLLRKQEYEVVQKCKQPPTGAKRRPKSAAQLNQMTATRLKGARRAAKVKRRMLMAIVQSARKRIDMGSIHRHFASVRRETTLFQSLFVILRAKYVWPQVHRSGSSFAKGPKRSEQQLANAARAIADHRATLTGAASSERGEDGDDDNEVDDDGDADDGAAATLTEDGRTDWDGGEDLSSETDSDAYDSPSEDSGTPWQAASACESAGADLAHCGDLRGASERWMLGSPNISARASSETSSSLAPSKAERPDQEQSEPDEAAASTSAPQRVLLPASTAWTARSSTKSAASQAAPEEGRRATRTRNVLWVWSNRPAGLAAPGLDTSDESRKPLAFHTAVSRPDRGTNGAQDGADVAAPGRAAHNGVEGRLIPADRAANVHNGAAIRVAVMPGSACNGASSSTNSPAASASAPEAAEDVVHSGRRTESCSVETSETTSSQEADVVGQTSAAAEASTSSSSAGSTGAESVLSAEGVLELLEGFEFVSGDNPTASPQSRPQLAARVTAEASTSGKGAGSLLLGAWRKLPFGIRGKVTRRFRTGFKIEGLHASRALAKLIDPRQPLTGKASVSALHDVLDDLEPWMLEQTLQLPIKNWSFYRTALTATGALPKHLWVEHSFERLEFLGDAVALTIVRQFLLEIFPAAAEGELTQRQCRLVSAVYMYHMATQLQLHKFLVTDLQGMRKGHHRGVDIMADVFEAVLGAIYLDHGMEVARAWMLSVLTSTFDVHDPWQYVNWKVELTRFCRIHNLGKPVYKTAGTRSYLDKSGFRTVTRIMQITVKGKALATVESIDSRMAEFEVAREALRSLGAITGQVSAPRAHVAGSSSNVASRLGERHLVSRVLSDPSVRLPWDAAAECQGIDAVEGDFFDDDDWF